MRRVVSLLFVLGFLAVSGIARAADSVVNEQGAAVLKKQIEESVQWRIDMAKSVGQGLTLGGDIEVAPKGSFYEVNLPQVSVLRGPQVKLDIGTVIVNATPGAAGEWQTQVTFPSTMTLTDTSKAMTAQITIGEQRFSGVWWPEKDIYAQVDSLYQNIQIRGSGEGGLALTIGSFKSNVDMKENSDGTWSGPLDFDVNDIRADVTGKKTAHFEIAKIFSHSAYDRLDMRQTQKFKKDLQNLMKPGQPPNEKDVQALMKETLSRSPISIEGMKSAFEISGMLFRENNPDPAQPPREFSLDKATFLADTSGMQQEKSKILLITGFSGLKSSFMPADFAGLLPDGFNAEIRIDNLPAKRIMETMLGALQQSLQTAGDVKNAPEAGRVAAEKAFSDARYSIPKMMQEAGTSLTVQNTFTKSAEIDTSLNGQITADAAAVLGATGKMTFSVRGMDETLQKLQAAAIKPGADPQLMGYVGGLTGFQMAGQITSSADGKTMRNYVLELSPDGTVLMNGTPLPFPMMGMGKAQPESAPAPVVLPQSTPAPTP